MAMSAEGQRIMQGAREVVFVRPHLYEKQWRAIFTRRRYGVIEASTKTGKTVGCLAWLAELAAMALSVGWNGWWVAPSYSQARIAYRRMKRFLPANTFSFSDGGLTITMHHNGAIIWFKSADNPDALYGEDVHAAVIDESTRCKDGTWAAIRSTLTATRGPVRVIGNVKGRKNWAFRLARQAEKGDPAMRYSKLTAWDAVDGGVLAREEVEDAQRLLPTHVFDELYLAKPTEDGANPFGIAHIGRQMLPPMVVDAILSRPVQEREIVCWGVDLAKSANWTVAVGLDAMCRVVAVQRWRGNWEHTIPRLAALVGTQTPALIDSTGVGDPIFERLRGGSDNWMPFIFGNRSKQHIMERLAVAIQQGNIHLIPGEGDDVLRLELEAFEYRYSPTSRTVSYEAPEGMDDDTVCALALALECFDRRDAFTGQGGDLVSF